MHSIYDVRLRNECLGINNHFERQNGMSMCICPR
jgi:hypothetical protein